MIATTRYQLALLAHSQRYLPPLLGYLATLAILYSSADAPALPEFAISTAALLVVACWLVIALVGAEDPAQRLITMSHARRRLTVLVAPAIAALTCTMLLTLGSLCWAMLVHGGVPLADLGWGLLAHIAGACWGIAIGLACSQYFIPRIGFTVLTALPALAALLLVRWLPLVNPMLRALAGETAPARPVLLAAVTSVLALGLSTGMATAASRR
ncbi:hypothetical protein BAY61_00220 [Prauserella marina]|uniref:Uncharacterized protein n=1 Tax=Prauserella marina TaxID=530584 RepID=A0A222VIL6_9PSEU|nr:hypothetical protein [Prauserella marina]ASR33672.1 hypothetical protein BAY61_00220 [Prauserella marina]PWV82220.1 hypothetical protein DES30_102458 [Prauserella marina]SDD21930.1 hypothetical protein SAMN05421630_106458 [Prauserella marina]